MKFSLISPTFDRPEEVREFIASAAALRYDRGDFEVILADGTPQDGLRATVEAASRAAGLPVIFLQEDYLPVSDARNLAARHAQGDYLIFLDSDCLLPEDYLQHLSDGLVAEGWDAFGGPDAAPEDFSPLQKAISFSMTSFWTTGGIRGGTTRTATYYPRGFNMGMKRSVFESVGGYDVHFKTGEDVDLSIRIQQAGYRVGLIPKAVVWHKRRSTLPQFFKQVRRFGSARWALAKRHPGQLKVTHLFPVFLTLGTLFSILLGPISGVPLPIVFIGYFLVPAVLAGAQYRSARIGLLAVASTVVMMSGYAYGFMEALLGRGLHTKRG